MQLHMYTRLATPLCDTATLHTVPSTYGAHFGLNGACSLFGSNLVCSLQEPRVFWVTFQ